MFVLQLAKEFSEKKIPYLLVGGYALAIHGIVRATVDIDFVVSLKQGDLEKAEGVLTGLGLKSRLPLSAKELASFHEDYRKKRNLIAWSFVDFQDPSRVVDLMIYPPLKKLKGENVSIHGVKLRVATLGTLLEMKLEANRPEDQRDIQELKRRLHEKKK